MRRLIVASILSTAVVLSAGTAAVAATAPADLPSVAADGDNLVKVVRDSASLQYLRRPVTAHPVTGKGATRSDFDGDRIDDLAAGTDNGIMVTYSSAPYRDFLCPETYCDYFGGALASGDFNADGFDDLVIGSPQEEDPMSDDGPPGGVWMFPGGPEGLDRTGVRHWTERSNGIPGSPAAYDGFGQTLAVGDITGDGHDDLAIGVPGKLVSKRRAAGAVVVLRGSVGGISTTDAQLITQSSAKMPGTAETDDIFGASLAIGKVNKDRYADLVIGAPGEDDAQGGHGSGSVSLVWGSAAGLTLAKATTVTGNAATGSTWKHNGNFLWYIGAKVAVTDTTGDGFGEVITGSSSAQINNDVSGAVLSFAGRAAGLSTKGMKTLSLDTAGVTGTADLGDEFGATLAVGDVTGDGLGDVLVGAPGERVGKIRAAGAVILLRGSKKGLTGVRSGYYRQGSGKVPGSPERDDRFGSAIALLNLNGTGGWDAVVGSADEQNTGDPKGQPSGGVTRFVAGSGGLTPTTFTAGSALGMNDLPAPLPERVETYGMSFAGPHTGW